MFNNKKIMVKLQQTKDGQFFITFPKALVQAKKWNKGQVLKISFNERGHLEIED